MFFRKKKKNTRNGYERRKRASSFEERFNWELPPETVKGIWTVIFFIIAGISLLSFFGNAGLAGQYMTSLWKYVFGRGWFAAPFIFFTLALFLLIERLHLHPSRITGFCTAVLAVFGVLHLRLAPVEMYVRLEDGGGVLGMLIAWPLVKLFGYWGSVLILAGTGLIGIFLLFHTSFVHWVARLRMLRATVPEVPVTEAEDHIAEEGIAAEEGEEYQADAAEEGADSKKEEYHPEDWHDQKQEDDFVPLVVSRRLSVDLPLTLLDDTKSQPLSRDIRSTMESIQKTLHNFGVVVEMGEVSVGPTVTQYTLKPAEGVKLSSITALHNDLALALAAHPIRIEAPIPGKALVGIEVPNKTVATVRLHELVASEDFKKRKSNLMISLGKDVAGNGWLADLGKMPHLLIAGATGSGKSVCINALIVSFLYQNTPDDLRFIMVDPKRVELPTYNGIPHLLTTVITEVKKTVNALNWALGEMDKRLGLLSKFGKKNLATFNKEVTGQHLPHIVIIIDELADIMAAATRDVEMAIIRLSQMARSAGIHLVVATQRPSVDVITGLIKANIPTRIAFRVASQMDSRTILDTGGAEKLIGNGDMLYLAPEIGKPKRLQGVYLSEKEIAGVVDYLKSHNDEGVTAYDETITEHQSAAGYAGSDGEDDDLLPEAIEVVKQTGKASATLLQRRLKVGYPRAARLLDIMEEKGFIGSGEGAKTREVYMEEVGSFENVEEE